MPRVSIMSYLEKLPGIDETNTTRRNATVTAIYLLAGAMTLDVLSGDSSSDGERPRPTALHAVSEHTEWLQASARFSGHGRTTTDPFGAERFTTFTYEYEGSDRFALELVDAETDAFEATLVDVSGPTSGVVGTGLPSGQYALGIEASDEWTVELGEPAAPDEGIHTSPVTIAGEGTDVFGKVVLTDTVTVRALYEGPTESDFIVSAWEEANTESTPDEILFEEFGDVDSEVDIDLSGFFYIAVESDGVYHLEME